MKSLIIQLSKTSKSFIKEHKEIKDIILFGSLIRGKEKPNDIDILIIFKNNINKNIEYRLRKLMENYSKNISIISKTEREYIEPTFDARESVLFEGYSLTKSKFLAGDFGFVSFGLFFYNTKNLTNVNKTRFYYTLNGRYSNNGLIDKWNAIRLSDNIIAVPLDKVESAKEFFEYQNINYKYIPSLIPQRLGRKSIIGKSK